MAWCLLISLLAACSSAAAAITPLQIPATPVSMNVALKPTALPVAAPISDENLVHLFDYDQTAKVDMREAHVVATGDYLIHDISYESPKGGWVAAYLVTPPGAGPFAGIIFLHPGGGDRSWFLDEAKQLAKRGAISLLIDDNFSPKGEAADQDRLIRIIVDVRRAIDLLTARSDIDPRRIGFVGHSYGANLGGVLAGVEHRIAAYVLMSGNARMSQDLFGLFNWKPGEEARYLQFMAQLDGIHFIGHAAPAALLFQNARHDVLNVEQDVLDFQQTASAPKTIRWYDAYHQLNEEAAQDRADWLSKQLKLRTGPLPGKNFSAGPRKSLEM
jgi:dienelactone hydrolase